MAAFRVKVWRHCSGSQKIAVVELVALRVDRHRMRSLWLDSADHFDFVRSDITKRETQLKGSINP